MVLAIEQKRYTQWEGELLGREGEELEGEYVSYNL